MSDIRNIVGLRHLEKKKIHKKISFSEGEILRAKIKSSDGGRGVQLRTVDGWEFKGELEESVENNLTDKFFRFRIKGIKDGKVQLEIIDSGNGTEDAKNSIENIIEKMGFKNTDKTREILKMMIKLKMPLTKENITSVSSLLQFQENIKNNEEEQNVLVDRLLKNISKNSKGDNLEAQKIELKSFLKELGKVSSKELLFMMKNKVGFSGKNIEAFRNMNSGSTSVFDIMKNITDTLKKEKINIGTLGDNLYTGEDVKEIPKENVNKNVISNALNNYASKESGKLEFVEKMISDILKESSGEELKELKAFGEKIGIKEIDNNEAKNSVNTNNDEIKESVGEKEIESHESKDLKSASLVKSEKGILVEPDKVKESINDIIKDTKETLKALLSKETEISKEIIDKVQGFIQKNIENIKVFNSISDEYYYFDSPLKYGDKEYPTKLIIKDERKRDKKIDSKNVKLVVSLTTEKMGVIDSFIQIKNDRVNIEMKCIKRWKKVIELSKSKLIQKFEGTKFLIDIKVSEKIEEVELVGCDEFFDDKGFTFLDVKV